MTLRIDQTHAGKTLAAITRRLMPTLSWSQVRKLIASRRVTINASVCLDDGRRLVAGEQIDILADSPEAPAPRDRVQIVFHDPHLVVVEKPAGMAAVRRIEEIHWSGQRKARQPVLIEVVEAMLARRGERGALRAVHRLDRDTSGLMLFARSAAAQSALIRLFSRHEVERVYRAVVHGKILESRTIDTWLVRDRGDGLRGSLPPGQTRPDAKRAITHIKPVAALQACTLIECRLETGRTHQIRIHLAEIGHMLCGEKVYRSSKAGAAPLDDPSAAPRQALHSIQMRFTHPITGRAMDFHSLWPKEMQRWMKDLAAIGESGAPASTRRRTDGR